MFCCMSTPVVEEDKPLIVDLNEILCNKAWNSFKFSHGPIARRCLKRANFDIEVPENYFAFDQMDQEITPRNNSRLHVNKPDIPKIVTGNGSSNNNQNGASGLPQAQTQTNRDLTNPEVVSLNTEFSNDTAEKQTYKFRFEKQRQTEINITFQKGFTFGGKANFSIGLPKVLGDGSLGLEAHTQYEVTKTEGQRFQETMLMEATSDIVVGPTSHYTANIQLEERTVHADFKVVTRVSMPQGKAPVYIKRKRDGAQVHVYSVHNLKDSFGFGAVPCAQTVVGEDGRDRVDQIDFVVEGVLKGSLSYNHKILLNSDENESLKLAAKEKYFNSGTAGDRQDEAQ